MNTEYLQFRMMSVLARRLPRHLAYAFGARVSDALFRRQPAAAAAVAANHRRIRAAEGRPASEEELPGLARATYRRFSRHLADFFRFPTVSPRQVARLVTTEGMEHADAALARGKGVLAVSAHIGSWELSIAVLRTLGYPMHLVVLPMKDPKTNALFERCRLRHTTSLIPLGASLRPIIKALKANEVVGIAADIDYTMRMDLVPIFGAPARLPIGPARLAVMTGAPILVGTLHQRPGGRYHLRLHPPILAEEGSTPEAIEARIVAILENEILEDPTQWYALFDYWNVEASLALSRDAQP